MPVNIKNTKKYIAFTLAEVLITLTVVGIVATMTIPVLMSTIKKNTLKSQYKKAYSTFQLALKEAITDYGYRPACAYSSSHSHDNSGCNKFWRTLYKKYKVIQHCPGHAYRDGCIPNYKGSDEVVVDQGNNIPSSNFPPGFNGNTIRNNSDVHVMNDGTIFIKYGGNLNVSYPIIGVDINGQKGPNKWGCDLYAFTLYYKQNSDVPEIKIMSNIEDGCGSYYNTVTQID